MFGRFWVVARAAKSLPESAKSLSKNVKTHQIWIKITKICTKIAEICWEWLDLAKSHQIWLRTCWISSDLSLILPELYITSVGLGGLGFGEENPPLDQPALGLGCGNPKPIVGASVPTEIGWRSGGLVGPAGHSQVWTPLIILYTYISSKKKRKKRKKSFSPN